MNMAKIIVQNTQITVIKQNEEDYISLTDMLKAKDGEFFFSNWLRNRVPLREAHCEDGHSGRDNRQAGLMARGGRQDGERRERQGHKGDVGFSDLLKQALDHEEIGKDKRLGREGVEPYAPGDGADGKKEDEREKHGQEAVQEKVGR